MMYHLRLLGPVCVTQKRKGPDTESAAGPAPRFRSRRTVALLGYLSAERRPHAREQLAALFWPDEMPTKGRSSLRRELYNLARVLPDCWQTDSQTVQFAPSAWTRVDIDILVQLESEKRWQDAAEIPTGEFLEGLNLSDNLEYENWLLAERERWRERSQTILHSACEEMARHGRYADALLYARRLLQLTPWDENTHRQVMRLLTWTDQRQEAVRQFNSCRQALADELGLGPSAETITLYEQIKAGDLEHLAALPAFIAHGAENLQDKGSPFVMREREIAWLHRQLDMALASNGSVSFLTGGPGRGKTMLLDAFADQAVNAHSDLLVARGNCAAYAGVGDPYLPFRDILAMLCGDVEARWAAGSISTEHARRLWNALPLVVLAILEHGPGLLNALIPGSALLKRAMAVAWSDAPWLERLRNHVLPQVKEITVAERSTLFEQFSNVLRAVATERPLLLLLDDIQWMDAASVGLLFHLLRRIAEGRDRILILCAYRPEDIIRDQSSVQHLLAKALSEFRRMFGDVWLSLGWVDACEGRRFVDTVLDSQPNNLGEAFRAALFQRTGGHPLFTIELLQAMRERETLIQNKSGAWQESPDLDWQLMPGRVEAVIKERVQNLEPQHQELLSVASVEGARFTVQVLAQVQNLKVRPLLRLLALDLGSRHRLVQEQEVFQTENRSIAHFEFRHVLFQEYLYKRLGQAERQMLHGAVAAALEDVYADELEAISVQLGQHFDKAGNFGRAMHYFNLAADNAARIYAYEEAIAHYTRALSLTRQVASSNADLAGLYHMRGLAYGTTGKFELARADLELALELSRTADKPQIEWQVLIELGKLWASRDYREARDYFEQALGIARRMDDPERFGRSLNRMGNWHANDEEPGRALAYHQDALRIFEELDDRPNLANTLDLLGIAQLLSGDYPAGAAYYHRAVELFRELGDFPHLVSSLVPRAIVATGPVLLAVAPAYSPRDPFDDLTEAVELARRIGSSPDESWSSWALALLHTRHGDFGRALEAGRRGLQIAADIQHREWQVGNRFALGVVYNELLQPEKALQELQPGLALAEELGSRYWVNHVRGALAYSSILLNDLPAAERCLETAISDAASMDTAGRRYCWARRAELALAMDEPVLALDITDRLVASVAGRQSGDVLTFLWLLKGETMASIGRLDEAHDLFVDGCNNACTRQERFLLWRFHGALGQLYQASRDELKAAGELSTARVLIEDMAATVADGALANTFRHRASVMLN